MPSITTVYENFGRYLSDKVIIRLLGGDRKEIEQKTGERWNAIVDEKPEKAEIVEMVKDLLLKGKQVIVNVNNHYEGSAPKSIECTEKILEG